ncbi:MAG TPA: helix-turn-helix transcriptional regulator [Hanamia sp.]|nr:helix-turn-helix transcriptional regulator [Hanamia sp.]
MKQNPYDIYLKRFGNNLRNIRKEKGLTMEAVANEAEIEYRQLGRIERGEINTTIISLLRIAEILKVDMKMLFDFERET